MFLIYYRPFKDLGILIANFAGEIAITLVMGLSIPLLWNLDDSIQELLEMIIIGIVLNSMLIQIAVTMISSYKSLLLLWIKYEKARSQSFVNSFAVKNLAK